MAAVKAIAGLMKWARREEWRGGFEATFALHSGPACARAGIAPDDLESLIGSGLFGNLWGCIFEDFVSREDADGRNVADDYLRRRGWKEAASDKAYLAGLRSSALSLYEVSDIVPGESCLMRDLIRGGEAIRVRERSGTRCFKPWDRIAARVVSVGSANVLGGGLLAFRQELCEEALKAFRRMRSKARREARSRVRDADPAVASREAADEIVLQSAAPLFTTIWLADVLDRALNRRMPELLNSDGDEFLLTNLRYPLLPGVTLDAVRAALDTLRELDPASDTFWNWIGKASRKTPRARASESSVVIVTLPGGGPDDAVVLGNMELEQDAVVLSVNSAARAERGRKMLASALAGLVGAPVTQTRSVAELMAAPREAAEKPSPTLLPEEERAISRQFLERHYAGLLDKKIPVLGNRTPRQAAKTAQGRMRVAAWLKYLENASARRDADDALSEYDFGWLWEALGIADLRR
jgi:hypothetical protein